jgi:RimJ/RimL family protein N-acetyltransferase/outer membrane protein OmpA-like peptidoglycan-associated protein
MKRSTRFGIERNLPEVVGFHGRRVCLRPLRADDRPLLEDLIRRTDQHDLRLRFFGGFRTLPPTVLDQLMLSDPERRTTLVATSTSSRGEPEILAVARAHALNTDSDELGLLVRSDLKGMGMGSMLLDKLITRCRNRGVSVLVADVLRENVRMLRLADKYGFRCEAVQCDATRLVLDLKSFVASRCGKPVTRRRWAWPKPHTERPARRGAVTLFDDLGGKVSVMCMAALPVRNAMEIVMSIKRSLVTASMVLFAACAGQPQTFTVNPGQSVTMPRGTLTGGASVGDANTLAKMVVDDNNNAMAQFDKLGGDMSRLQTTDNQELLTSQQALTQLEQLSDQQGSGQITLFFVEGSTQLDQEQRQRLIRFLDYLSRESQGRKVILLSVGSASAVGSANYNRRLSLERSQAPLPTIEQYLVNTPHEFYKVSAVGDVYAPKNAPMEVEKRYQNVRIVAAYTEAQLNGA